jgi:hypothetical protein
MGQGEMAKGGAQESLEAGAEVVMSFVLPLSVGGKRGGEQVAFQVECSEGRGPRTGRGLKEGMDGEKRAGDAVVPQ